LIWDRKAATPEARSSPQVHQKALRRREIRTRGGFSNSDSIKLEDASFGTISVDIEDSLAGTRMWETA
jgi:hypothetical protein